MLSEGIIVRAKVVIANLAAIAIFAGGTHGSVFGETSSTADTKPAAPETTAPMKDRVAARKGLIPATLEDCFPALDSMLTPAEIKEFKETTQSETWLYHFGLGTSIRNEWGLWNDSRLACWFNERGIKHPDDMSGIILDSYWRYLNKRPIDLGKQIKVYQAYWKNEKIQPTPMHRE